MIGAPLFALYAATLGGATLCAVVLAAVAALAFVLGAALARRVVPAPWATWAALLAGASPVALGHATVVVPALLVPAAPVAVLLARWTARRGRTLVALGTAEIQLASLVFYVSLNERLHGGLTP